ncbi:Tyrosine-protein kinase transmembrane receptor ROR2 [Hypsibius exemplaris]|uniref:Tyrosine-protein kinase transmembrane receptor ROR2 n=1 Tax=Hypsibius exemplaris TaxID=2072580 RepID=A0A1W0W9A4_HYPEX|nr:Tyrosine-protein kinase transmembrane receptor ROR2 [Hypsibius exemplaris]
MADEESASISADLGNSNEPLDADVMSTDRSSSTTKTTTVSTIPDAVTTTRSSNFLYIVEPLANITINSGKEARIKCHVKGNPPPKFRWFKNEAPFESERRGRITIRKEHDGSKIRIRNLDVPDTGYYRCEASNGFQKVETTGILKVLMVPGSPLAPLDIDDLEAVDYPGGSDLTHITEETDEHSLAASSAVKAPDFSKPGVCQPYKGTACAKFLHNATVFTSGQQTINEIEEGLMAAFSMVPKHTELSSQCTEYAVPSLCYHMFPVCDGDSAKKRPRQMCRDECELLESEICRKEYAIANGHPVLKEFTPDCHKLPNEQSTEHKKCIRLGLRPSSSKSTKITKEECYTGDGQSYSGMHRQTVSGAECRKWDGVKYPELAHHNYCRNPDGLHQRPWCMNGVSDAVEPCNIQKCGTQL